MDARGLGASTVPQQGLSYSAPNAGASGEVEVRNQRGQVEGAATAAAQRQAAAQAAAVAPAAQQQQRPQQGQPQQEQRGAFGQRTGPATPPPASRAERRAQETRK